MDNELKKWDLENYYNKYRVVFYVDEVGRGCLCGDVVSCAVAIPKSYFLEGVKDSKKLTPKKREALKKQLVSDGIDFAFGRVSSKVIDEINILNATYVSMNKAIQSLSDKLKLNPDVIVVDGNPGKVKGPCLFLPKGDQNSFGVACASILAKQYRDSLCADWENKYPGYQIDKHKGYGTKVHRQKLLELGPSPIHRQSFLGKILGDKNEY